MRFRCPSSLYYSVLKLEIREREQIISDPVRLLCAGVRMLHQSAARC
jgi:hypothetical protein